MKLPFLLILFHLPLLLCGQAALKGPWKIECGVSTNNALKPSSFNLRYISPRFKWSHKDYNTEEKDLEKFKNGRIMAELLYNPPFKVFGTSLNVQCRLINYKRLSIEAYGGVKFFFVPGPDFKNIYPLKGKKYTRYLNMGLLFQFNLGVMSPFADFGSDSIITIGTELNLHAIYRKPKNRYNLRSQQ